MKVIMQFPPEVKTIKVEQAEDGSLISITLEPIFYKPDGRAPLCFASGVSDGGAVVSRCIIGAFGSTGEVFRENRTKAVKAKIDGTTRAATEKTKDKAATDTKLPPLPNVK